MGRVLHIFDDFLSKIEFRQIFSPIFEIFYFLGKPYLGTACAEIISSWLRVILVISPLIPAQSFAAEQCLRNKIRILYISTASFLEVAFHTLGSDLLITDENSNVERSNAGSQG
jgi:hypothetical protein